MSRSGKFAILAAVAWRLAAAATAPVLEWSKRWGGTQNDAIATAATDRFGNIYIAGTTNSIDLPANGALRHPNGSNLRRIGPSGAMELLRGPLAGAVRTMTNTRDALYVATTAGVMLTRDGNGTTWEILPIGDIPKTGIAGIAVDPANAKTVYLAAQGLWKTIDSGNTWARIAMPGELDGRPAYVHSVSLDPRTGTVYTIALAGAFRSADRGASWTRLPGSISSIAFDSQSAQVVYATGSDGLRMSENGGVDWTALPAPGVARPEDVITDPSRPGTVYVRSGDTLDRSSDRGKTWKQLPIRTFRLIASTDAPVLYAQTGPYGFTTLMQSRDAGDTWTNVEGDLSGFDGAQLAAFRGAVFLGGPTPESAFAAKFDASGELTWSTYLPGSSIAAIAIGQDQSLSFAANCMRRSSWNGSPCKSDYSTFVGKVSPDGQRILYTSEFANGVTISSIAVDAAGSAYITGVAGGLIPTTPGTLWPDPGKIPTFFPNTFSGRIFAAKFSPDGSALSYSTYLGDWATASFGRSLAAMPGSIVVDAGGNAIVAGPAIWKLGPAGTTLEYSTKIGELVTGGALDSLGNLVVTGYGSGNQLFTSPGSYLSSTSDASMGFVTRLSPAGEFLASTLMGPSSGGFIALGADDSPILSRLRYFGATKSLIGSAGFGHVVGLDAQLSALRFSSPVVVDFAAAYVGLPRPEGLALVNTDGADVVLRAYRWVESEVAIDAIVNAASAAPGPLAPGELVRIRGAGFGRDAKVRVQDVELAVERSSESELWVSVPSETAPPPASKGQLVVESTGQRSQPVEVSFAAASPALFTVDASGTGQALALNDDGTLNSADNPAARGSVIGLAVNGLGKHRMEGGSVVPPHRLSVFFDNAYANGVDANLVAVAGLPAPVVVVKVVVPSSYLFAPSQSFPRAVRVWINIETGGFTPVGPTVWIR